MSRFVKPQITRLYLADVHKRAHAALVATKKAKADDVAASEARVEQAVAEGDFIDVIRRLNAGEQQELFARMAPESVAGEVPRLNTRAVMTTKVLAYLVGWSLTDDGTPVPYAPEMAETDRLSTLKSLDPDTFREIRDAIDDHEAAVEQEIADLKNVQAGASAPKALSASVAP